MYHCLISLICHGIIGWSGTFGQCYCLRCVHVKIEFVEYCSIKTTQCAQHTIYIKLLKNSTHTLFSGIYPEATAIYLTTNKLSRPIIHRINTICAIDDLIIKRS